MGTFHQGKSELHGITVVVETEDGDVYVGRCDDMDEQRIILLDADMHRDGEDGCTTRQYLSRAEQVGVWKKFDRLALPRLPGTKVRRLGELGA